MNVCLLESHMLWAGIPEICQAVCFFDHPPESSCAHPRGNPETA